MDLFRWFRPVQRPKPQFENPNEWATRYFPDSRFDVATRVAAISVEQVGINLDEFSPTSRFIEDLQMTDLEPVDVVMALEEDFRFKIPDADAECLETVADLISYMHKRVQSVAR